MGGRKEGGARAEGRTSSTPEMRIASWARWGGGGGAEPNAPLCVASRGSAARVAMLHLRSRSVPPQRRPLPDSHFWPSQKAHRSTLKRSFIREGIKVAARRPREKPDRTDQNKKERVKWCEDHQHLPGSSGIKVGGTHAGAIGR